MPQNTPSLKYIITNPPAVNPDLKQGKPATHAPEYALYVTAPEDETDKEAIANIFLNLPVQAANTLADYLRPSIGNELEFGELVAALQKQVNAVNKDDMKSAEGLLTAQAFTLDAIFHRLAQLAQIQGDGRWFELYLKAWPTCTESMPCHAGNPIHNQEPAECRLCEASEHRQ